MKQIVKLITKLSSQYYLLSKAADKEPDWVINYKKDKKNFYIEGDKLIGIGAMSGSQNINMLKAASMSRARTSVTNGYAATLKADPKYSGYSVSVTIGSEQGLNYEEYPDVANNIYYTKISVPTSSLKINTGNNQNPTPSPQAPAKPNANLQAPARPNTAPQAPRRPAAPTRPATPDTVKGRADRAFQELDELE